MMVFDTLSAFSRLAVGSGKKLLVCGTKKMTVIEHPITNTHFGCALRRTGSVQDHVHNRACTLVGGPRSEGKRRDKSGI
jgi:ribosomal protein L37E